MKLLMLWLCLWLGSIGSFTSSMWLKATAPETLWQQQQRLEPVLWKIQKQFDLNTTWVSLHVRPVQEMVFKDDETGQLKPCECWGMTDSNTNAISVLSIEDMPESMPWNQRAEFQKEILQHEVMHIRLTALGMPTNVQDHFIMGLQPALVKP